MCVKKNSRNAEKSLKGQQDVWALENCISWTSVLGPNYCLCGLTYLCTSVLLVIIYSLLRQLAAKQYNQRHKIHTY